MTISAKVVADSISEAGKRITTLQLRYPKFVHGELMTHRVFSRNASSSRAIPVPRLIQDVIDDPVYPSFWGKNQPGMSASEEHDEFVLVRQAESSSYEKVNRETAWAAARETAIDFAQSFTQAGYHKQIVNRLLEPFCHINVVVTATEFSNFFALRCHPGAQPEMRILAEAMRDAMADSKPEELLLGQWHVPYVSDTERVNLRLDGFGIKDRQHIYIKLSVARCARVSYLTQEGKTPSVEEDLKLYDRLVGSVPLHASPAEHQATPDTRGYDEASGGPYWSSQQMHGNFVGWIQYRKSLPGESQ